MNMLNSIIVEGNIYPESIKEEPLMGTVRAEIGTESMCRGPDGRVETVTDFFPVVMSGSLAGYFKEHYADYERVRVVGRLRQHRWADADGRNHSAIVLLAEHVEFAGNKSRRKRHDRT